MKGQCPGHDLQALLHEAADGQAEAVAQHVLVLQDVGAHLQAQVWVIPLVVAQPGGQVDEKHEEPQGKGEGVQEGEVFGLVPHVHSVEDADSQGHEGFGEVPMTFSCLAVMVNAATARCAF